jgi:hypothetical protein
MGCKVEPYDCEVSNVLTSIRELMVWDLLGCG